jgi:Bacterial Ig-like domain (group 3)
MPPPDTIGVYAILTGDLEQVFVRGISCRSLRLQGFVAVGLALAVLPVEAQPISSQTALGVETRDLAGRTQASASVAVTGADGLPATGVVSIVDGSRTLAQAALNADGKATAIFSLSAGDHALRASYLGDAAHQVSISSTSEVTGQTSGTPNFAISLAPVAPSTLPLSVTAGNSGTIAVTLTPEDNAALTAPMFVTLSCSGLPSQSSCAFTPESLEILATTPASCAAGSPPSACPPVSSMLVQTQGQGGAQVVPPAHRERNPVAWAILLPGIFSLGGFAWAARRRPWLQRATLVALVGLVSLLGTTACNPRYYYEHHGPPPTPPTPTGTYNLIITAQSSNGVTSISNTTTMVLTVQ